MVLEEIRLFLAWDPTTGEVTRRVNSNVVADDGELLALVLSGAAKYQTLGKTDFPVIIDAAPGVPWKDVIRVMDLCRRNRIPKIELAQPELRAR